MVVRDLGREDFFDGLRLLVEVFDEESFEAEAWDVFGEEDLFALEEFFLLLLPLLLVLPSFSEVLERGMFVFLSSDGSSTVGTSLSALDASAMKWKTPWSDLFVDLEMSCEELSSGAMMIAGWSGQST